MSTYLKTTSIIALLSSVFCLDHSCVCYGCDESASFMREHQANKQTPLWVSHYKESLPKLMCENPSNFSMDQKAAIITQYLCQFVPPKVHLHDECGQTKLCTKILSLMESGKQFSFALCGFPFKSKNHKEKCLGNHVDVGEYLALMNLQVMMGNIKNFYPKAHCTIFSDGLPYHTEIDPIYDEIFAYHAQMGKLVTLFPDISFVSWKIHEGLSSYVDLQREFSQVQPKAIGDNQLSEMKAFVTKEMNTTFWQEKFLNEALQFYGFTSGETVGKRQKQVVSEKKNTLKNEKIASIAQE
ncbi:MAG: isocyanide synthase family protein, partial [Alphaproteobacteria bacterium]|nr:isocyanide synthase family protein [Alphaproteobacteria bacterium]